MFSSVKDKLKKYAMKYPAEKVFGSSKKYMPLSRVRNLAERISSNSVKSNGSPVKSNGPPPRPTQQQQQQQQLIKHAFNDPDVGLPADKDTLLLIWGVLLFENDYYILCLSMSTLFFGIVQRIEVSSSTNKMRKKVR